MSGSDKAAAAFRTIGEVTASTGVAAHVLRYWETRFPQLRPVTRAGNRRYYRPEDVALVERIQRLLGVEGYTVKGVQKLLANEGRGGEKRGGEDRGGTGMDVESAAGDSREFQASRADGRSAGLARDAVASLTAIRDRLQRALDAA